MKKLQGRSFHKATRRIAYRAKRSYIIAFVVLCSIMTTSFIAQYITLNQQESAATVVAETALQEAYAQRIGLLISALQLEQDETVRGQLLQEIRLTQQTLRRGHSILLNGDPARGIPPLTDPVVRSYYFEQPHNIDFKIGRFLSLVDLALSSTNTAVNGDVMDRIITSARTDLPVSIEALVLEQERIATNSIQSIKMVSVSLYVIQLLALALVGWFIFRPLVKRILSSSQNLLALEDALNFNHFHDTLTGLPNREGAQDLFRRRLSIRDDLRVAVLQVSFENLGTISDVIGFKASETALIEGAERLKNTLRRSDFVARIDGDQFAIILPSIEEDEDITEIGRRILSAFDTPVTCENTSVRLHVAIGIAIEDGTKASYDRLMGNASIALADARTLKVLPIRVYQSSMRSSLKEREVLVRDLTRGISANEVIPFFQPQISGSTGELTGFEALARWQHPDRGLIPPGLFIPVAEQEGLDSAIGVAILRQSLDSLQRWEAAGHRVAEVGVNFSAGQLRDSKLVDNLKWELDRFDISPERISIEVLESVMGDDDAEDVIRHIRALSEAGFTIDLDDFGTGHASISNIRAFNVDRIKIDRSFVTGVDKDSDLKMMTTAMVRMAEALRIECLAEGVETHGERAVLSEMGCTHLQGFGIGRPMHFDDTLEWMTEYRLYQRTRSRQMETG